MSRPLAKPMACSLVGGDTIALPPGAPRVLSLTAVGRGGEHVPDRAGAGRLATVLWLVGTLGDAATGLALLQCMTPDADRTAGRHLSPPDSAARRPARHWRRTRNAMMDVVGRAAARRPGAWREASGCSMPRSTSMRFRCPAPLSPSAGRTSPARLFAATGGDDYALIAALPPNVDPETLSLPSRTRISRIGSFAAGELPLSLTSGGETIKLPETLGFGSTRVQTIAGFPVRQWLIGLSGLISGMAFALLLR